MMRIIVSAITGVFMALYFMYIAIPLLYTTHQNFGILVNSSDTTIATSYNLGQGFYTILPLIPLLVSGFVIINYSLKRDAGD